jgi:DNA-binding CsgD family transcriptional regulator
VTYDRRSVAPPGSPLTDRELQVIAAIREHVTYREAAGALGISEFTVKEHLANARSRCGVRRTWELFGMLAVA